MRSKSYAVRSKTWMWNIREWLFLPAFWLWEKNSAGKIDVFTAYVCAAQRGRDAFGTAMRSCASLSRRLSVFFESTPNQDPKAANYAVLIPGHAGFPKHVKQSEGSDSAPSETPPVSPCKPLCAIFLRKASVYPLSGVRANVGRLWEKLKTGMRNG